MSQVLLFDLDDTLLENDIEKFIPVYFHEFSKFMADIIPPQTWIEALKSSIEVFQRNLDPRLTLQTLFEQDFFPRLNVAPETIAKRTGQFYRDIFPKFQTLTKAKPGVPAMIDDFSHRGHQIVLATNPLFPKEAILHRLDWAGFRNNYSVFEHIPAYETAHFSKPHPEFYAELMGTIGWPKSVPVMVGNDLQNDILPAQLLDFDTFLVSAEANPDVKGAWGPVTDLPQFLSSTEEHELPHPVSPRAIVAILRSTPAAISTMVHNVRKEQYCDQPIDNEWCLTQIFCHLRDVDKEVNIPRVQTVLMEDKPFIHGIDTDRWAYERGYRQQDGVLAFKDFVNHRVALINLIQNLADSEWHRPASHTILGPTDLREILEIITQHDQLHVRQIHKTLAAL